MIKYPFLLIFLFISTIFPDKLSAQSTINNLTKLESKYKIKIYSDYGSYYFPVNWYDAPMSANGTQIEKNDIDKLTITIDNFLSKYDTSIIQNNLDAIYLMKDMKIMQNNYSVVPIGQSLYMASYDGKNNYSDSILLNNLHDEFASILFDLFPNIFPTNDWNKINEDSFTYNESNSSKIKNQNQLLKSGFLSANATNRLRSDFATLHVWKNTKQKELDSLILLYDKIKQKVNLYTKFYDALKVKQVILSNNVIEKIDKFQKEYNVNIHYNFSAYFFPKLWNINPYYATGKQASEKNIELILNILKKFLNQYNKDLIHNTLKDIYILSDFNYKNKPINVYGNLSSIYISDNEITKINAENNYLIKLNNEFAIFIWRNFNSYFPEKEWELINKSNSNITKNNNISDSLYNQGYLNYQSKRDILDDFGSYWNLYFNDNKSLTDLKQKFPKINSKFKIITLMNYKIDSLINQINSIRFANEVNSLEQKYNIKIITDFLQEYKLNGFILPANFTITEKINKIQLYRILPILKSFLDFYSIDFINSNLKNIYLSGAMRFLNSNRNIAGTYEPFTTSLLLVNIGNSDEFLLGTLHHEFSSLLLHKYSNLFPYDEWKSINSSDFQYNSNISNKDTYQSDSSMYKNGFITKYCTTYIENDINEYAKWATIKNEELKKISSEYNKVNLKYNIIKNFYNKIGNTEIIK